MRRNPTFFPLGKIRRGPISYIAQTGNFATHTMKWIMTSENFGVARVAGLGNKIDIEDSEVLEYLGRDPETKAVLMYVEGFRQPRRFFEVARRVTREKPVVILKGGAPGPGPKGPSPTPPPWRETIRSLRGPSNRRESPG